MRSTAIQLFDTMKASSRKLGPYVLLELLLPGGTLFALALFLYRRQPTIGAWAGRAKAAMQRAFVGLRRSLLARSAGVQTAERLASRSLVGRMAECLACPAAARFSQPGRRGSLRTALPAPRSGGTHRNSMWRSRSFTAGGCPGSLRRG